MDNTIKELIGRKVNVGIDHQERAISGKLVQETAQFILIKGNDGGPPHRIPKQKIWTIVPTEDEGNKKSLVVLACENPSIGCSGVQCIKSGGYTDADFNALTGPCPKSCESCVVGSLGDIDSVDRNFLDNMLSDTLFGDYPNEG